MMVLLEWSEHTIAVCAVHSHLYKIIIREGDFYDRMWTSSLVRPRLALQFNSKSDGERCLSVAGMSLFCLQWV